MRNWFPKLVSLLLAIAIWFLIRNYLDDPNHERYASDGRHLQDNGFLPHPEHSEHPEHHDDGLPAPKAMPVDEDPPARNHASGHPLKAVPVEE